MTDLNELRVNGTSRIEYHTMKMVLNKDNLDMFEVMLNKRDIRKTNVNKLRHLLLIGEHFETPLICNKKGNKFRLIDGNHRHEAIKGFLDIYPQRSVEIVVCYYDNLSPEEERKKFTTWNSGTKQSVNDFVALYWDEMPIAKLINNSDCAIKVAPAWQTNKMELKQLILPYLTKTTKPASLGAMDFIDKTSSLNISDFKIMKQFAKEIVEVFGPVDRANLHYKSCVWYAIARLWYLNCNVVKPTDMKQRLAKLRMSERVLYWSQFNSTRENIEYAAADFLKILNKGRSANMMTMETPQKE